MADISQIVLPDGNTYSIKDTSARTSIPNKIDISEKGAVSGVAELDSSGKVPLSQIPSDVNNIAEYADYSLFPSTGANKTLYIDTATDLVYRWNGFSYIQLNNNSTVTAITNAEIDALF